MPEPTTDGQKGAVAGVRKSRGGRPSAVGSPTRSRGIKFAIYRLVKSFGGLRLLAPLTEMRFRLWRIGHPGASFADFYGASIAKRLRDGRSHKTLGTKQYLTGGLLGEPKQWNSKSNQSRGRNYFELILDMGLAPHHRCIDYGCGSLRMGQHLMTYLDRGNYWGMDVVSDFYEAGKLLLRPGLIEEKHPQLHVISAESVRAASQLGADFVVSIAVLGHVRPDELGVYFGNISSMMGKDSIAIITLNPSAMTKRCAGMTWDYSEADLARELRAVAPDLSVEFRWLSAATRDERNDLSGMILRRVTDQRKWDDTARFLASSGVSHEPVHQQPGAD